MDNYDENKFEEINPEFYLQEEDAPELDAQEAPLDELSQDFVNKMIGVDIINEYSIYKIDTIM